MKRRLWRYEVEAGERHELEGEWMEQMEKLGHKLTWHNERSPCFSCSLTRFLGLVGGPPTP